MASAGHGSVNFGNAEDIRLVVDTIPGLVWSTRPDGSAEFFNQRWLEYTGLSAEQALDWGWKVAIHPDDLPGMLETFHEALNLGRSFEVEGRFRRWDGEFRWFLFRGNPLLDGSGKVVKWYGTNTDLEDRKRAEDALRDSEQSFRLIVDGIAGLVAIMTAAGEIEAVNRQLLDYLGKTTEQLKGRSTSDAVHPDDLPNVVSAWRHSVETAAPYDVDHRLRRADGVYRWFHARGLPLRGADGRVLRWYVLLTDIEERKQAEENLRRSEWSLLEAQRLGHSGSWSLDVSSGIVTTSPEMFRSFGVRPGDDCSSPDFWFSRIHPEDRKRVRDLFERCVIEKTDYEADYRLLLPDGTIHYQHSIGRPIVNEAGNLVEFVGTAIDITEQVLAKADLEKAFAENKLLKDQLYNENLALRDEVDRVSMFEEIVGTSSALQAVLSRVIKVARTDSTVLITGETGTGKELIARAIHKRSPRSPRAFVSVNCAALAPSLISSELFGHEKGAFTGALQRRLGRFELADGGTIFLDEVGELPSDIQVALLRVLQEREFERVGGTQSIRVDVRVIAASNRDLAVAKANGTFRSDLFYRLNVFPIEVPPLRERKDDVLMLLEYFVHRYAAKVGKKFGKIDKRTMELFRSYDWPGNIRELQNVVERSVIVSPDEVFRADEAWLSSSASRVPARGPESQSTPQDLRYERQIIEAALAECRGRISGPNGAAAKLRIPPSTLDSKIKRLNISKSHFKLG
jgi:PAS domain S-box-containing protein